MDKMITPRQAVILVICVQLSTKFQRMPALLASACGRDAWVVILSWLIIDVFLVWLAVRIGELCKGYALNEMIQKTAGKFVAVLFNIFFIVYFFFKSMASAKGTHDFFAINLFEKLPWELFSFMSVILFIFLVGRGLRVLGRSVEFYSIMVVFGIFGIMILGLGVADYSKFLPIMDNNYLKIMMASTKYNLYFGDFLIFFMFIGNIKKPYNLKKALPLVYFIVGLVILALFVIFYGIYENLAKEQTHGLADVIQFTLVGLGIGRIDWFLVLFTFIYTILATALFAWVIYYNILQIFNLKQNYFILTAVVMLIYVFEVFIIRNAEDFFKLITNYYTYFATFMQLIVPFILLIIAAVFNKKYKKGALT